MANENPTAPAKKKIMSVIKIYLFVLLAIVLYSVLSGDINKPSGPSCNCQYEDGAGNKKRTHAMDYKYCRDLLGGEWLGDAADCEVPRYSSR
ncbi:MAG: hypothetical protein H7329_19560 [Opitutaceae bacterium]|nr:hypothetical protein [Cytophagales bacterium]